MKSSKFASRSLLFLSSTLVAAMIGCSAAGGDGNGTPRSTGEGSGDTGSAAGTDGATIAGGATGAGPDAGSGSTGSGAPTSGGATSGTASTGSGATGNGSSTGASSGTTASATGGSDGGPSGEGGASGDGGGATGSSTGGPCSAPGLILCDDFESDPLGMKPSGKPWLTTQCSASGFTLKVDETASHSGSRSLASQGVPYSDCMLQADLGTPSDFWVRAWVRFAKGDANQFSAHEVSAFELTPASQDDPGIRVGFRGDSSCQPTGVEVNITGGEEKTGCTGSMLTADTWYCWQLHVVTGASGTTADLMIDGADQSYNIHGQSATTVVNPNPAAWRYLRLGTRSYSNQYPSIVYVDDIAVGTQQIPCN